jgi:organic radical activating enzyme
MAFRRGGTPLLSTNAPTLEAANQSQINDLIERSRDLERKNKKLSAQLAEEVNRSKASVKEIQDKHEANQRHWKESCEDVLASYRIIQKHLEVELEKERYATLAEMGVAREEKLQRIKRDFKLKLFQMHDEDLEKRLEEVEEERYDLQEQREAIVRKWTDHCLKYATKLKDTQEALERSETEKKAEEVRKLSISFD